MKLSSLDIRGVRNLREVSIARMSKVNIFYGENGAGKSSVLEAIHMLALARSFRSSQLNPVINYSAERCTVFGRLLDDSEKPVAVGVQRQRRGGFVIKIDGEIRKSVISLAELLPVQLINAMSYQLLDGGPKQRRQFLDWGVFHVKQPFYEAWRKSQRCIKQRNAALRQGKSGQRLVPSWDQELVQAASIIDDARRDYFELFKPLFIQKLGEISDLEGLEIHYARGWQSGVSLEQVLIDNASRDLSRGLTHAGPHRADLRITVNGVDAAQVLSRGQLKLVVCALRLAQCELMQRHTGKRCLLLVDDLPAEVDLEHQWRLCRQFDQLGVQLFVTCILPDHLAEYAWSSSGEPTMFHVKQGQVIG